MVMARYNGAGRNINGKYLLQQRKTLNNPLPTMFRTASAVGILIFVSHDRKFVSSLTTRILEVTPDGIVDFHGNYDEYLKKQGLEG